jgi:pre-mRNA-processing factor 17
MDQISGYDSDSVQREADDDAAAAAAPLSHGFTYAVARVDLAPEVIGLDRTRPMVDTRKGVLMYNPKYEDLQTPVAGPVHPLEAMRRTVKVQRGSMDVPTGYVEEHSMNLHAFETQYRTHSQIVHGSSTERKRRVGETRDVTAEDWRGPWAPFEGDDTVPAPTAEVQLVLDRLKRTHEEKLAAQAEKANAAAEGRPPVLPGAAASEPGDAAGAGKVALDTRKGGVGSEKSFFYGKEERDYQGRSWLEPPSDLKPKDHECYMPKQQVGQWCASLSLSPSLHLLLAMCGSHGAGPATTRAYLPSAGSPCTGTCCCRPAWTTRSRSGTPLRAWAASACTWATSGPCATSASPATAGASSRLALTGI